MHRITTRRLEAAYSSVRRYDQPAYHLDFFTGKLASVSSPPSAEKSQDQQWRFLPLPPARMGQSL